MTSLAGRGAVSLVLTPVLSVIAAFVVGAVIIAWAGENPLEIYRTVVVDEVLFERTGWRDTLIWATPLVLIGVGLGLGFKANVWNIGAEGQMIVGGLCAIVVIGYVNDLPGALLIPLGLVLGAVGGGLWGAVAGWVHVRYGVNVVIATLLLVFIAEPLATWAVRDPLKDPETYLPQSRVVGNAALPEIGWIDVHIGALLVLLVVPVATWLVSSTRLGFLIRAHGGNETATTTNEVVPAGSRCCCSPSVVRSPASPDSCNSPACRRGWLRGSAAGFGFTAIIVAVVGRNHPVGCSSRDRALGDARRCRGSTARTWAAGQPDADDPGPCRRVRRGRRRRGGAPGARRGLPVATSGSDWITT